MICDAEKDTGSNGEFTPYSEEASVLRKVTGKEASRVKNVQILPPPPHHHHTPILVLKPLGS